MTSKQRATDEDVMRFIRAVYPEAPHLALASFNEKKALNDAAELIEQLRQTVADKESDCARLHNAFMDAKYPETKQVETTTARRVTPERIDQTVLGPKGNCNSACLAMLLGLRIEDVPNFNDSSDYNGAMQDFLAGHGYGILTFPIGAIELRAFHKGYGIAAGESPRGHNHAVLYFDGELWHDPHPDRSGVEVSAMDVVYPLRPFARGAVKT
jgi:hypothetical protein